MFDEKIRSVERRSTTSAPDARGLATVPAEDHVTGGMPCEAQHRMTPKIDEI